LQVGLSNKLPILDKDGIGVTGLPIAASHSSEKGVNIQQMLIASNDSGSIPKVWSASPMNLLVGPKSMDRAWYTLMRPAKLLSA
jgi:hypothetical protein